MALIESDCGSVITLDETSTGPRRRVSIIVEACLPRNSAATTYLMDSCRRGLSKNTTDSSAFGDLARRRHSRPYSPRRSQVHLPLRCPCPSCQLQSRVQPHSHSCHLVHTSEC